MSVGWTGADVGTSAYKTSRSKKALHIIIIASSPIITQSSFQRALFASFKSMVMRSSLLPFVHLNGVVCTQ